VLDSVERIRLVYSVVRSSRIGCLLLHFIVLCRELMGCIDLEGSGCWMELGQGPGWSCTITR